jgi:hypothetical protein
LVVLQAQLVLLAHQAQRPGQLDRQGLLELEIQVRLVRLEVLALQVQLVQLALVTQDRQVLQELREQRGQLDQQVPREHKVFQ